MAFYCSDQNYFAFYSLLQNWCNHTFVSMTMWSILFIVTKLTDAIICLCHIQDLFFNISVFKKFWFQNWCNQILCHIHQILCHIQDIFIVLLEYQKFNFKTDAITMNLLYYFYFRMKINNFYNRTTGYKTLDTHLRNQIKSPWYSEVSGPTRENPFSI